MTNVIIGVVIVAAFVGGFVAFSRMGRRSSGGGLPAAGGTSAPSRGTNGSGDAPSTEM